MLAHLRISHSGQLARAAVAAIALVLAAACSSGGSEPAASAPADPPDEPSTATDPAPPEADDEGPSDGSGGNLPGIGSDRDSWFIELSMADDPAATPLFVAHTELVLGIGLAAGVSGTDPAEFPIDDIVSEYPQELEGVLVSIDVERWTTERQLRLTAEGTSVCLTFDEDGAPGSHLC